MKKISFLVLLLAVMISVISVYAQGSVTLSLSSVDNAAPGDEVAILLDLSGNPGVAGLIFTPDYDKNVLEFSGIDHSSKDSVFPTCTKASEGDGILCMSLGDTTDNGKILGLKFKIIAAAASGKTKVTVGVADGDMKNLHKEKIIPQITEGYVTVVGTLPPAPVLPTSITLNPSGSASVERGKTLQINATVLPASADDKTVRWESSDPTVAAVDANGRVTGVAERTAVITVTSNADPNVPAQIQVTVTAGGPRPQPRPHRGMNFWRFDIVGQPLPRTGFSALRPQALPEMPLDLNYQPLRWTLEIPSLSIAADLVKVPNVDGEYPITWLGDKVGLLEGFAMPGEGYTVLTGHNHLNTTEAGPFALLSSVEEGDRIFVRDANDGMKIFVVYANEKVSETDYDAVESIAMKYDGSLTMVTCEDERVEGGYANRRIVAARPY